ncbi:Uncharacterized protein TCM_024179, partial [Theobroma cacao]
KRTSESLLLFSYSFLFCFILSLHCKDLLDPIFFYHRFTNIMPMHSAQESRNRLGRLFQHKVFRNEEEAAIIQQQVYCRYPTHEAL